MANPGASEHTSLEHSSLPSLPSLPCDVAVAESPTGSSRKHGGAQSSLDDRSVSILVFERQWWHHGGQKEEAIRKQFGFSPARYYQLLGSVMKAPAALAYDPLLVKRLLRVREARAQARMNPPRPQ